MSMRVKQIRQAKENEERRGARGRSESPRPKTQDSENHENGCTMARSRKTLSSVLLFGVAIGLFPWHRSAVAQGPDQTNIESIQKSWWESISTLEFRCDEYPLGETTRLGSGATCLRFHFAQAMEGRRALEVTKIAPDGSVPVERRIDAGKVSYTLVPFSGHPDSVSSMLIENQRSMHDNYQGVMFSVLWVIMPGGIPIARQIERGGELTAHQTNRGPEIILVFKGESANFACTLDPLHDWLPASVDVNSKPPVFWRVTRFTKESGHWFPQEGRFTGIKPGGAIEERGFQVHDLRINRGIPTSRFARPTLAEGTYIRDQTATKGTRVHSANQRLSRAELFRLRERYALQFARPEIRPKENGDKSPLTAARDEPKSLAPLVVGVFSLACLLAAAILVLQYRRNGS